MIIDGDEDHWVEDNLPTGVERNNLTMDIE